MIENRFKRAFWAVTILIILVFGSCSAYNFIEVLLWQPNADEARHQQSENFFNNLDCRLSKQAIEEKGQSASSLEIQTVEKNCIPPHKYISYDSIDHVDNATKNAKYFLLITISCPLILWSIFFLFRWIWTGTLVRAEFIALMKQKFLTRKCIIFYISTLGILSLFVVGTLFFSLDFMLGSLVSSSVKALCIFTFFWIVSRLISQKKNKTKENEPPDLP